MNTQFPRAGAWRQAEIGGRNPGFPFDPPGMAKEGLLPPGQIRRPRDPEDDDEEDTHDEESITQNEGDEDEEEEQEDDE